MARTVIELPTLTTVLTRVGVLEVKIDQILALLAAGGTPTPTPTPTPSGMDVALLWSTMQ